MSDLPAKRPSGALARLVDDALRDRLSRLEPHTRRSYNRGLDQFTEWLESHGVEGLAGEADSALRMNLVLQALRELGPRNGNLLVEAYLKDLLYGGDPYARGTVECRLTALQWAVREAHDAGEITWLLGARMPIPRKGEDGRLLERGGRVMTGPTPREAIDMLAACETRRDRLLFLLCRVEGYRIHRDDDPKEARETEHVPALDRDAQCATGVSL
jgi:hypothetical protein